MIQPPPNHLRFPSPVSGFRMPAEVIVWELVDGPFCRFRGKNGQLCLGEMVMGERCLFRKFGRKKDGSSSIDIDCQTLSIRHCNMIPLKITLIESGDLGIQKTHRFYTGGPPCDYMW